MGERYFSKELFTFLSELKRNNEREWFNANKERYEDSVREPFLNFIAAAGPRLRKISPHVLADPRPVGGSLFRIHRDVRFSRDKSPYKTHAGAHFRHAAGKDVHAPGFYLHLEPGTCFLAGGMYRPEAKGLRMIRDEIAAHPDRWKTVLRTGLNLSDEEKLTRPPQGFEATHPMIEDIKRKSFIASVGFTDSEVCGASFMAEFVAACKGMNPLMKFLARAVGAAW